MVLITPSRRHRHATPILILSAIAMLLAGCESTIVLRNPSTGEMAQCTTGGSYGVFAVQEAERCAEAYQSAGWERMTE
jgi:hypothetical protein